MANQIRPVRRVFSEGEAVVLEIAIESAVTAFTWAVFAAAVDDDQDEQLVAVGWKPKGGGRRPAPEHSITVSSGQPYEDDDRIHDDGSMQPGDYQVRLYSGKPKRDQDPSDFVEDASVLDSDAFTVAESKDRSHTDGVDGDGVTDVGQPLRVALVREGAPDVTARQAPVSFDGFREFLQERSGRGEEFDDADSWPAFGTAPYQAVRNAARAYVAKASRVRDYADLLPGRYTDRKLDEAQEGYRLGLPRDASTAYLPGVELIWNYWLEEGMLVQTLNVILARFQNRRLPGRDPLARFDVTPLLPLRNKLWGFAEDEVHRMTVRRRAVEYEYEYGFPLIGRAIPRARTVVERRTGFIDTFHQVLFLAHRYFKELDDLTVQADPFPLYRALRDCHIVLSQGTQNQYGEMAVAARAEFLVMQSILAEAQMREFLGGRPMTPYPERWMDRVDTMKTIQGWTDTSIMHFNDLATIGEQLVLTIRLGDWAASGINGSQAARTWAQALRPSIQQYAAAYRTATGVDLSLELNTEFPATLLARRLDGVRVRA